MKPGTKVCMRSGVRVGEVIGRFPWRNATAGLYKCPEPNYVPVRWPDGTKGYYAPEELVKEPK